jgi:NDP-sugar pyrophosphorylase family protein
MKAAILAGGLGARIFEETHHRPLCSLKTIATNFSISKVIYVR